MSTVQDEIRDRILSVRERVTRAAERAGRDPADVTLLGACKTVDRERVLQAVTLGVDHLGENFVQEADDKFGGWERPQGLASLHFIGHLQSNKLRRAVALFDAIQSVDSVRLLSRIDAVARELGRRVDVYVQVNLAGEGTKEGVRPEQVRELAEHAMACENVRLAGLMAVPPHAGGPGGDAALLQDAQGAAGRGVPAGRPCGR